MHRSARVPFGAVALAVAGASSLGGCSPLQPVRAASSYTSHTICSETFISGLPPAQVYAETVATTPFYGLIDGLIRYHVDPIKREVSTTVAGGFLSRAVYRDGLGCILVHQADPRETPLPKDILADAPVAPPSLPDIAGPDVVTPADPALKAAIDRAFAEPSRSPERLIKAVVVVRDGRVIAERYAPGYGIDTPQLSFSMAKTVINALIGILVRDGRLVVDQPAPVAAWRDPSDPRHGISIDNLLRHNSGLALEETGSPFDVTTRMLMLEDDTAKYAEAAPLIAPIGSRWHYSSPGYAILSRIVRDAVGGNAEAVLRFARRELFDPLGMRRVTLEFDAVGTPLGSSFMFASARDWARLGMLYLGDGVAGGRRILPQRWVGYSSRPTPGAFYGYAAGLWTSLEPNGTADGPVGTGLPPGAFFANGRLGQFILIVPSERLVLVRLGITQAPPLGDDGGIPRLVADVIAALHSKGEPAHAM
jgi:CubicO group peptidase (beta-lactamase class C family)